MNPDNPIQKHSHTVTILALCAALFAIYGWQRADQRAFNAVALSGNGAVVQKIVQAVTKVDQAVGALNQRVKALEGPPQLGMAPASSALASTNPAPTTAAPATSTPAKP